jgi:predicted TIM-barrel fold metal-dependent hydrolase
MDRQRLGAFELAQPPVFDTHMPLVGREIATPKDLLRHLDRNAVTRAVVVPLHTPNASDAFASNDLVLEAHALDAERIVPGFWVDPSPRMHQQLMHTLKIAREESVRVLKVAPQTWEGDASPDPKTWSDEVSQGISEIIGYAHATGARIQIHTGSGRSRVSLVERFMRQAETGIPFHLVHMGGSTSGHFYLVPRLAAWIADGIDVVVDTSLSRGFGARWLLGLASLTPALRSRILFASDEPWGAFASELAKVVEACGADQELANGVLWRNAERLYGTGSHR